MDDIRVEPLDGPGRPAGADGGTVTFGRDGRGLVGWLRDHPRLRAIRAWRPSYGVVAIVSAMVAGTAVAVYMDRPVEEVRAAPADVRPVLPESWLNVQVEDQVEADSSEELERMLARHPPDAIVTKPLDRYQLHLFGIPPGTYHVQASCSAEARTPPDGGPAWFVLDILDPTSYEPAPESYEGRDLENMVCDGELHTVSASMTITGYRALVVQYYTALDEQADTGNLDVFLAISFTPVS